MTGVVEVSEPAANPPAGTAAGDGETAGRRHSSLHWWPVVVPVVIV
jgi:hypothetical protein